MKTSLYAKKNQLIWSDLIFFFQFIHLAYTVVFDLTWCQGTLYDHVTFEPFYPHNTIGKLKFASMGTATHKPLSFLNVYTLFAQTNIHFDGIILVEMYSKKCIICLLVTSQLIVCLGKVSTNGRLRCMFDCIL